VTHNAQNVSNMFFSLGLRLEPLPGATAEARRPVLHFNTLSDSYNDDL